MDNSVDSLLEDGDGILVGTNDRADVFAVTGGEPFTCRVQVLPTSGGQPRTAAMLVTVAVADPVR